MAGRRGLDVVASNLWGLFGRWRPGFPAALLLLWLPLAALAQDPVQWTTNYYAIFGTNLAELRQSINRSRPWKDKGTVDGQTVWSIRWRFSLVNQDGVWRCGGLVAVTTIITTLPRWAPPASASPAVREAWKRYLTALATHEAGHAQVALAARAELRDRVEQAGTDTDSRALTQRLNGLANQLVQQYRHRDAEYDERTAHGAKQGAVLPRRPPEPGQPSE